MKKSKSESEHCPICGTYIGDSETTEVYGVTDGVEIKRKKLRPSEGQFLGGITKPKKKLVEIMLPLDWQIRVGKDSPTSLGILLDEKKVEILHQLVVYARHQLGITKPKPFVTIEELSEILTSEHLQHWITSSVLPNYIKAVKKAASAVAKKRGKK